MSAKARVFTPENRLANVLSSLEGIPAGELVVSAQARVAALETAVRGYVAMKLDEIMAFTDMAEHDLFAECRTLGGLARNVAEVAGAAGLAAIGEVAAGIDAMVESLVTSGVWHTDALRLHLDALALLNGRTGASAEEDEVVLARLRNMRKAIGVVE